MPPQTSYLFSSSTLCDLCSKDFFKPSNVFLHTLDICSYLTIFTTQHASQFDQPHQRIDLQRAGRFGSKQRPRQKEADTMPTNHKYKNSGRNHLFSIDDSKILQPLGGSRLLSGEIVHISEHAKSFGTLQRNFILQESGISFFLEKYLCRH